MIVGTYVWEQNIMQMSKDTIQLAKNTEYLLSSYDRFFYF